jgi:hypothetical protein
VHEISPGGLRDRVIVFYSSVPSPRGTTAFVSAACTPANMAINLSNYSYFFLDVHAYEAYLAAVGMYSTVLLREE